MTENTKWDAHDNGLFQQRVLSGTLEISEHALSECPVVGEFSVAERQARQA